MSKIIAYFQKGNIDAFLAAYAAKLSLPPNSPLTITAVQDKDVLPKLDGKYLMFFGIQFDKLGEPVDMTKAANCLIIGSIRQASRLFTQDLSAMPPAAAKEPLVMKMYFTDTASIFSTTMTNFVPKEERRKELTPALFEYILSLKDNVDKGDNAMIYAGVAESETFMESDLALLEADIERFKVDREAMIQDYLKVGRRAMLDGAVVDRLIETYAMTTSDFSGYRVKIAHVPEEFVKAVGRKMAIGEEFAVVYEDRLATNTRIYHLFSESRGMDVMKIGNKFNATGNARYCCFSAKMNFSNNRWL